jgi:hypothetical protein
MPVDIHEKIKRFAVKELGLSREKQSQPDGIILPAAFIAKTATAKGMIPAGVEVIAERNIAGQFRLTWWDSHDNEVSQVYNPDELDYSEVLTKARASTLAAISTGDLRAEIERREYLERQANDAGSKI